tara:strand:- start:1580 stop:2167 length:588 start_codon:yes stop_codon:yes gene_type:complete
MKIFISILILIFSLQSLAKTDDIKELEIEGFSIGDSLLEYFSLDEIKSNSIADYKSKKFVRFLPYNESLNLKQYEAMNFHYKSTNYEISEISGAILYNNNLDTCLVEMKQIIDELEESLGGFKKIDQGTRPFSEADTSGESTVSRIKFEAKDKGAIYFACYRFSEKIKEELNWTDSLRISLTSKEFITWLDNEAY